MSRAVRHHARHHQRGIAAVELALILPLMLALLTVPLLFGRVFWHYTVAQKAAHDTARYLSEVPLSDITSSQQAKFHYTLARDIAAREMSDLNPGSTPTALTFECNYQPVYALPGYTPCDDVQTPKSLRVTVQIRVFDTIFPQSTLSIAGSDGLLLSAQVAVPYVQN